MKRIISIVICVLMLCSIAITANAESEPVISFNIQKALYAHAVSGSADKEAWQAWQSAHDDKVQEVNPNEK